MAVLTIHHWDDEQARGVRELRRVARGPVVILTYDACISARMWLMAEYLHEVRELDRAIFPPPERVAEWLGDSVEIETILSTRDTQDWNLGSFWAHPERVLDADARRATSGFARMAPSVVDRVVAAVAHDLAEGTWDERHGNLRSVETYDVGLRLIISGRIPR
jgi:hypothetical protein